MAQYLEQWTRFEVGTVRTQVSTATAGPNWIGMTSDVTFTQPTLDPAATDVKSESPALCMYLKCLLLAASRRAANQHQETPSATIYFQAEFICTAFELLVLDGGSTGNSTAPFIIRSH